MPAKRSPWFNARAQPPVNGGDKSVYEWRCEHRWHNGRGTQTKRALHTVYANCDGCQWRGLLREASIDAARAAQGERG